MIARHATRASHLPDHLHAAPPLTREELRRLDWDYERALKASKVRGLLWAGALILLSVGALLYVAVWP
jgi:hypothetical protein